MTYRDIIDEAMRLQQQALNKGDYSMSAMTNYLNAVNEGIKFATEEKEENDDGR